MNFLFGALLLIILLLPGIIFRIGYLSLPSNKVFRSSFLDELLFSIIPAIFIQIPAYCITNAWICNVDERVLYLLLVNNDKIINYDINANSVLLFGIYTLLVNIVAFICGVFFRKLIRKRNWDITYPLLKIHNDWDQYFNGLILDKPGVGGDSSDVTQRWLDVLVETKDGNYLYSGFLEDYVIARDEKLERIYLHSVRRRKLSDDRRNAASEEVLEDKPNEFGKIDYSNEAEMEQITDLAEKIDTRYYFMPGDFFMIPGDEIRNINITYYSAEEITT